MKTLTLKDLKAKNKGDELLERIAFANRKQRYDYTGFRVSVDKPDVFKEKSAWD